MSLCTAILNDFAEHTYILHRVCSKAKNNFNCNVFYFCLNKNCGAIQLLPLRKHSATFCVNISSFFEHEFLYPIGAIYILIDLVTRGKDYNYYFRFKVSLYATDKLQIAVSNGRLDADVRSVSRTVGLQQ